MTPSPFHAEPAPRQRVADLVFESLAKAILDGTFKPDEPLSTQRDLAQQFNVSALVVRQAIHRLEDLGLVRVRQGSATIVLDPRESSDIRLIQLQMELVEPGAELTYSVVENRMMFLLPMLVLAERRITEGELAALRKLVATMGSAKTEAEQHKFRGEYWLLVAKATRNPLFEQQVRWFSKLAGKLVQRGRMFPPPRGTVMMDFHAKLVDTLAAHSGTLAYYLSSITPMLDWAEAQKPTRPAKNAKR